MPDTPRGILSALAYILLVCAVCVYGVLYREYFKRAEYITNATR